ncbi:uncharacterized protein LOC119767456 isoform X1 [Culex quinquefasciatus]|uniref:uncharacterized protein LOC119767456 isoform X1 n=1 Tax=Culex quinquefasciatus TaxID=7176 RepID=UPI0018E3361F|nr:uncharacterized protein LOC119767456 isoform X1 [Culex quinquefasciatus]XP_039450106.1 uncharacterized protein LOC120429032 isoform X1 [Culex pipiens pallens]
MKFYLLFLFTTILISLCESHDSTLLKVLNRIRRAEQINNQKPVNYGFPVFGTPSWPTFNTGGGWSQQQQPGGSFGNGAGLNLQGRFDFGGIPSGGKGNQVSAGSTCTYSKDGKQKCHQWEDKKGH